MGAQGRRVEEQGASTHLVPPTSLDNFQIILNTYEFDLRFKERIAGNATEIRVFGSSKLRRQKNKIK